MVHTIPEFRILPHRKPIRSHRNGPLSDSTNVKRQKVIEEDSEEACISVNESSSNQSLSPSESAEDSQSSSIILKYQCAYDDRANVQHTLWNKRGFILLQPGKLIELFDSNNDERLRSASTKCNEIIPEMLTLLVEDIVVKIIREDDEEFRDPHEEIENFIRMPRPDLMHQYRFNKGNLPIVDVHINPLLANLLRPHQIEGVEFLYKRIMRMDKLISIKATIDGKSDNQLSKPASAGAILADEMGLGKTLQVITLIEMLLRQDCYKSPSIERAGKIKKVLIICTKSLLDLWANEFKKWLGDTVSVQCINNTDDLKFRIKRDFKVVITSYDILRIHTDAFLTASPMFDLLVCDEAHRLKKIKSRKTQAVKKLAIKRNIFLTGTLTQNNIQEFYTMFDLIASNYLGSKEYFKEKFLDPILESKNEGANLTEKALGKKRLSILQQVTAPLFLRRQANTLTDLPTKHEFVIFCNPSPLQHQAYSALRASRESLENSILETITNSNRHPFEGIHFLRLLNDSPDILIKDNIAGEFKKNSCFEILKSIPNVLPREMTNDPEDSGKLSLVMKLLNSIRQNTNDKVVLVSYYTKALDVIRDLLESLGIPALRYDGQIQAGARNEVLELFHTTSSEEYFILLLSAKAGGEGLNLIAANRLILIDDDWNPSNDSQAMARIYRPGQTKDCYIYRLILAGTIDEKIFQRQISKIDLGNALMGKSSSLANDYTLNKFLELYRYEDDTPCWAHSFLRCSCNANRIKTENDFNLHQEIDSRQLTEEDREKIGCLIKWDHFDFTKPYLPIPENFELLKEIIEQNSIPYDDTEEEVLNSFMPSGTIFFVFSKTSGGQGSVVDITNLSDSEEDM